MNSTHKPPTGPGGLLSAIGAATLRCFAIVAAAIFMLSMLVAGLLLGLVLTVAALLRGRRPAGIMWRGARWPRGEWRHPVRPRDAAGHGEVVDIEAREVAPAERREG